MILDIGGNEDVIATIAVLTALINKAIDTKKTVDVNIKIQHHEEGITVKTDNELDYPQLYYNLSLNKDTFSFII
jgi:protein involved in sex pheromone biosynthesis